jgi:CBS domain-containing protein
VAAVGDIMSQDLLILEAGMSPGDAAGRMHERHVGAVLVVERDNWSASLIGARRAAVGRSPRAAGATVGERMTRRPEAIEPSETTGHAAVLMIHGGFRHLPVLEGEKLVWHRLDPRSCG